MNKLKDEIHDCDNCKLYPCSFQDEVSRSDICREYQCYINCCYETILPLVPCEERKLENEFGGMRLKDNGWCYYFDKGCTIYEKRPIACRVATCRFITG